MKSSGSSKRPTAAKAPRPAPPLVAVEAVVERDHPPEVEAAVGEAAPVLALDEQAAARW